MKAWIEKLFRWSQAFDQEIKIAREFWRHAERAGVRVALVGGHIRAYHLVREVDPKRYQMVSPAEAASTIPKLHGIDLVCVLEPCRDLDQLRTLIEVPVIPFFQGYLSGQFRAVVQGLVKPQEKPVRSYILATSRRTGSTWLCHLLAACGKAGRPEEYLDIKRFALSVDDRIDPGVLFEQTLAYNCTPNGVFGAKIHWSSLQQFVRLLDRFSHHQKESFERFLGKSRYVFLRRRNKVRQAVSDWRARETGVYHLHYDASDSERARHLDAPSYNFEELLNHLRLLTEDEAGWKSYFAQEGITPLEVFYEDLVEDQSTTFGRVLDFLELAIPSTEWAPQSERLADQLTEEYCARFSRELEEKFSPALARVMAGEEHVSTIPKAQHPTLASECVLVTLATTEYLDRAKQFFSSAFHNGGWSGDFALLAHDIADSKLEWFRRRGVFIKHCPSLYQGDVGGMHPSLTSKYYLFTETFRQWETVIYSDLDAIVRAPLDELNDVLGFAAVDDWSPALIEQIVDEQDEEERGLDTLLCRRLKGELAGKFALQKRPFCAGFFAFSTCIIEDGMVEHLVALTDKYGSVSKFGDQLILNLYFYECWKQLNPAYNVLVRQKNYHDALDRVTTTETRWGAVSDVHPFILHLFDPKPWDPKSSFYLEWLSNLLKADEIDPSRPPFIEEGAVERVRATQKKIRIRQMAYDILENLGRFKLPVIRGLHFFDSRLQLLRRTIRFLIERANFVRKRWSKVG